MKIEMQMAGKVVGLKIKMVDGGKLRDADWWLWCEARAFGKLRREQSGLDLKNLDYHWLFRWRGFQREAKDVELLGEGRDLLIWMVIWSPSRKFDKKVKFDLGVEEVYKQGAPGNSLAVPSGCQKGIRGNQLSWQILSVAN